MMELIDAISIRLHEIFGDEYTIYLEEVEQGLDLPCFFIQPLEASDENMIDNRKYRSNGFVIVYIPKKDGQYRAQFAEVTNKLFDNFDTVDLGNDTILPTFDRNVNVVDEVLHFTIRFSYYFNVPQPVDPEMEDLDITVI